VLVSSASQVRLRCFSGATSVLSCGLSNHRLEPGRPGLQGLTLGLTCGMLTVAHAAWQPEEAAATCAPARRWRMRACCGRACAAFTARLKHAARRSSTAEARQRSCQQNARPLQSALLPLVEVVVGLAAARGVGKLVPPSRAVPSRARRARSRRCEVHMSVHRCTNVQWSCLCSAVEMCAGVCTVGVCTRVLARACACVLRKGCRTSLRARETALPFPSCATTGPAPRARGHPPWRAVHRSF
jgi:hypothetical protein